MTKIKDLVSKVQAWGDDKKITSPENVDKQYMKFIEEVLEFKTELDKGEVTDDLKLEMGDILVTLIIMAKQKGYDFVKMYEEGFDLSFPCGYVDYSTPDKTFLLLMEKAIDLGKHGLQVNFVEVLAVLHVIAKILDLDLEECLSMAYDKIKDRKGVTRDGKFIKKEDL